MICETISTLKHTPVLYSAPKSDLTSFMNKGLRESK